MAGDTTTVLVVEDEPPLVEIYMRWLETEFDVRTATDGEDALEQLDEDVDVVLLDRLMPGMSGDELLPEIAEHAPRAKVAMVTAVKPDFDVLSMGFDDYLTKPVDRGDLLETVYRLLEREEVTEMERELYALVSKQAALQSAKSEAELQASDEYQALVDDIEALRGELDASMADLDDRTFVSMVRELSEDRPGTPDSPEEGNGGGQE